MESPCDCYLTLRAVRGSWLYWAIFSVLDCLHGSQRSWNHSAACRHAPVAEQAGVSGKSDSGLHAVCGSKISQIHEGPATGICLSPSSCASALCLR